MQTALLPISSYLEAAFFIRERKAVIEKSWIFAGLTDDLPNSGDFIVVRSGRFSIAVIRDHAGKVQAFHNICRHRGVEILEGKGNFGKTITCPYHWWMYGDDGSLQGVPNATACFPDLERAELSLKRASIGILQSLIFIHPEPNEVFADWTKGLHGKLWPHNLASDKLLEAPRLIYDLQCNWKIFVENALDGYHLSHLHSTTLGGPKPLENEWREIGQHLAWYATDEKGVDHSLPKTVREDYERNWSSKITEAEAPGFAGVYFLYPATLITPTPYSFSISSLRPIDAHNTELEVRTWSLKGWLGDAHFKAEDIDGYDPRTGHISSSHWKEHPAASQDFQTEDVWICEKIQRGLTSPAAEAGPMAKGRGGEEALLWFQRKIEDALNSENSIHSTDQ